MTPAKTGSTRTKNKPGNSLRVTWPGILPRFSAMREGGPGRPATLVVMAAMALGLCLTGIALTDAGSNGGPPLLLFGLFWLAFLVFWILIKAGPRGRDVTFVLDHRGVAVRPSRQQAELDRRMAAVVRLVFLLTLKGGQWAAWKPFTPWKAISRLEINGWERQIVVRGGPWTIRLLCTQDNFEPVLDIFRERTPPTVMVVRFGKGLSGCNPVDAP
jgi:hypothetical protein